MRSLYQCNGDGYEGITDLDVSCDEISTALVRQNLLNINVQDFVEEITAVLNIIQESKHPDLLRHTKLNIFIDYKLYRFVSGNAAHHLIINIVEDTISIDCKNFPSDLKEQITNHKVLFHC